MFYRKLFAKDFKTCVFQDVALQCLLSLALSQIDDDTTSPQSPSRRGVRALAFVPRPDGLKIANAVHYNDYQNLHSIN